MTISVLWFWYLAWSRFQGIFTLLCFDVFCVWTYIRLQLVDWVKTYTVPGIVLFRWPAFSQWSLDVNCAKNSVLRQHVQARLVSDSYVADAQALLFNWVHAASVSLWHVYHRTSVRVQCCRTPGDPDEEDFVSSRLLLIEPSMFRVVWMWMKPLWALKIL